MTTRAPRPANRARALLHVASALVAVLFLQQMSTDMVVWVASAAFVWAWGMEIGRRQSATVNRFLMWVFGPVAHPHEREGINSATWYTTALFGLSLTHQPMLCSLGVTVLGFGDPMAAVVGRRFGRILLAAGRTLEGSLAFVLFDGAAAFAALQVCYPAITPLSALWLALGASGAGAVAEVAARRVDDNLAIPLAAAAGAAMVAAAL